MKFPGFKASLAKMRGRDFTTQADGFYDLRDHAADHLDELVAEFHKDPNSDIRFWLFELIVAARSPKMIDFFVSYLHGEEENLRNLARRGLKELDTREARRILWKAENDGGITDASGLANS